MPIGVVRCVRLCLIAKGRDWLPSLTRATTAKNLDCSQLLLQAFGQQNVKLLDCGTAKSDRPDRKWMGKWGEKRQIWSEFCRNDGLCHLSLSSRRAPEFGNGTQLKHIQHTANGCRFISLNNTCAKAFHIVTQKMNSHNSYYAWN